MFTEKSYIFAIKSSFRYTDSGIIGSQLAPKRQVVSQSELKHRNVVCRFKSDLH